MYIDFTLYIKKKNALHKCTLNFHHINFAYKKTFTDLLIGCSFMEYDVVV
jgi:hypothetical protein